MCELIWCVCVQLKSWRVCVWVELECVCVQLKSWRVCVSWVCVCVSWVGVCCFKMESVCELSWGVCLFGWRVGECVSNCVSWVWVCVLNWCVWEMDCVRWIGECVCYLIIRVLFYWLTESLVQVVRFDLEFERVWVLMKKWRVFVSQKLSWSVFIQLESGRVCEWQFELSWSVCLIGVWVWDELECVCIQLEAWRGCEWLCELSWRLCELS